LRRCFLNLDAEHGRARRPVNGLPAPAASRPVLPVPALRR
jgi:hypothetical protein